MVIQKNYSSQKLAQSAKEKSKKVQEQLQRHKELLEREDEKNRKKTKKYSATNMSFTSQSSLSMLENEKEKHSQTREKYFKQFSDDGKTEKIVKYSDLNENSDKNENNISASSHKDDNNSSLNNIKEIQNENTHIKHTELSNDVTIQNTEENYSDTCSIEDLAGNSSTFSSHDTEELWKYFTGK